MTDHTHLVVGQAEDRMKLVALASELARCLGHPCESMVAVSPNGALRAQKLSTDPQVAADARTVRPGGALKARKLSTEPQVAADARTL